MKVIIAGGREFHDNLLLENSCNWILRGWENIEIISGGANGADRLGEIYGAGKNWKVARFQADWDGKGKAAGPIRNAQMAEYGDIAILFWDGKSRGTESMMYEMIKRKKPVFIISY